MNKPVRSAREVVERYNYAVWNERDFDLVDELIADQIVRHGVDQVATLTRAQARVRVIEFWKTVADVTFTLPIVVADDDGEYVAIVYQADITAPDGDATGIGSIEVFRVIDGKITDVWNNTHQSGHWR